MRILSIIGRICLWFGVIVIAVFAAVLLGATRGTR